MVTKVQDQGFGLKDWIYQYTTEPFPSNFAEAYKERRYPSRLFPENMHGFRGIHLLRHLLWRLVRGMSIYSLGDVS
jgi:hypothetical protein